MVAGRLLAFSGAFAVPALLLPSSGLEVGGGGLRGESASSLLCFLDFMGARENCSYPEGSLLSHGSYAYLEVLCCWQTGVCWLLHSRGTCAYAS